MIITIDGPSGSGKSTVAKKLAEKLAFVYFDTGAMYRTVTYGLLHNTIDYKNEKAVEQFLNAFHFDIRLDNGIKQYFWNDQEVTAAIRTQQVTALVSEVAALPAVRHHLVAIQRQFAAHANAIFDGRDMGSVVFPHAELKIYLLASAEIRTSRRLAELQAKEPSLTYEAILADINRRDAYDSSRSHSPLRPAPHAHLLDSSSLTIDEVVARILALIESA